MCFPSRLIFGRAKPGIGVRANPGLLGGVGPGFSESGGFWDSPSFGYPEPDRPGSRTQSSLTQPGLAPIVRLSYTLGIPRHVARAWKLGRHRRRSIVQRTVALERAFLSLL
jgi:hypothetical protein